VISDRKKISTYPAAACKEVESQVLFGARAVAGRFWVARSIYLQVAVDCRLDQTYTNAIVEHLSAALLDGFLS
jgi:hypothetical protein